MLLIAGVVAGLIAVLLGALLFLSWVIFGVEDLEASLGLVIVLVVVHWIGLGPALRMIARSLGSALLAWLVAPAVGATAIFVVWFHWESTESMFALIAALTTGTIATAVYWQAPGGIAATPGPARATRQHRPHVTTLIASSLIALSLYGWTWLMLDLAFLTAPVIE